ncbi:DUF4276 family protein [Anaerobaca lacustris]|uniref:DUF4276 family protein n=1 Tax=Anaerobaca lacustris TaxID=3044600 RepID=A0AAW6U0C9_9BACT|nr:DUF4276 family protein [Sedimentisphaerales bacterium M17dextr]
MSELVFLLEEPSAQAMLEGLLPRLLPQGLPVRYIVFEGKSDLEAQLVRRLRYYRVPNARFVILRDKDVADCRQIKGGLVEKCQQARRHNALVRIACHELESWYLADLAAVERALEINGLAGKQDKSKYRTPDALVNPAQELSKLTGQRYQKVGGSRAIGPHLDLGNTRSRSFSVFVAGIRRLVAAAGGN